MILRTIEFTGLLSFSITMSIYIHALWNAGSEGPNLSAIGASLFTLPLAYFFADLFSGLVHWACDSVGSSKTPIWGHIVNPFRAHHDEPRQITRISIVENLGTSAIAGTVVFWLFTRNVFILKPTRLQDFAIHWFWAWFLIFAVVSNLFHRWSHLPDGQSNSWIRLLQHYRLILRPSIHSIHHTPPRRENYCILCGWANCVTGIIPWEKLEKILIRLGVPICFD